MKYISTSAITGVSQLDEFREQVKRPTSYHVFMSLALMTVVYIVSKLLKSDRSWGFNHLNVTDARKRESVSKKKNEGNNGNLDKEIKAQC